MESVEKYKQQSFLDGQQRSNSFPTLRIYLRSTSENKFWR